MTHTLAHTYTHTHTHNLCLSEDVRAQLLPFLQNMLGLFRWDVYLQGGGHGGVDEAVNDCGNLLLDGGLITVGMTEVLRTVREGQMGNDVVGTNSSHSSFKCLEYCWN